MKSEFTLIFFILFSWSVWSRRKWDSWNPYAHLKWVCDIFMFSVEKIIYITVVVVILLPFAMLCVHMLYWLYLYFTGTFWMYWLSKLVVHRGDAVSTLLMPFYFPFICSKHTHMYLCMYVFIHVCMYAYMFVYHRITD